MWSSKDFSVSVASVRNFSLYEKMNLELTLKSLVQLAKQLSGQEMRHNFMNRALC